MTQTTPVDRTLARLRKTIAAARERTGLTRADVSRRCGCARATADNIEDGNHHSRLDKAAAYAHVLGLDIAAVPPQLAHLLDLDADDVRAVLRAAWVASQGSRLSPTASRRVADILGKLREGRHG